METFRDILCHQIETLQGYFDTCAEASSLRRNTGEWVRRLVLLITCWFGSDVCCNCDSLGTMCLLLNILHNK